jgi:hypothetical protein
MPRFSSEKEDVTVDTDGPDGGFTLELGPRRRVNLSLEQAKELSEQIGYAVEFVNLYARGPR